MCHEVCEKEEFTKILPGRWLYKAVERIPNLFLHLKRDGKKITRNQEIAEIEKFNVFSRIPTNIKEW